MGYPSLGALKRWIKEYEKDPKVALAVGPKSRQPKYSREQQKAAVDYYFNHGQFIKKTVKALGYPGRGLLRTCLVSFKNYLQEGQYNHLKTAVKGTFTVFPKSPTFV